MKAKFHPVPSCKKAAAIVAAAALLAGCAKEETFGSRLRDRGAQLEELGDRWSNGEATEKEGRELVEEGRRQIAAGEDKIARGERLLAQGRAAKTDVEKSYGQQARVDQR